MIVKFRKESGFAITPSYAKDGDAGMDLYAVSVEKKEKYFEYDTGIAVAIPSGYAGLLFPRSSVSKMDLTLANCVGVLDSGYRGTIRFRFKPASRFKTLYKMVYNWFASIEKELEVYEVGDAVGQLVVLRLPEVVMEEVEDLDETERGTGGFGSSGR